MGLDHGIVLRAALFLVLTGFGASATFLSDDVLQSHGSTGRSLLQAIKNCPLKFEFMNYTIITSKCKGPGYPAKLCCAAFKEFACPYVDEINDLTTDCASTMFYYINLAGRYPQGLFANECKEGKDGLSCPAAAPSPEGADNNSNSGQINQNLFFLTAILSGFMSLFLVS